MRSVDLQSDCLDGSATKDDSDCWKHAAVGSDGGLNLVAGAGLTVNVADLHSAGMQQSSVLAVPPATAARCVDACFGFCAGYRYSCCDVSWSSFSFTFR